VHGDDERSERGARTLVVLAQAAGLAGAAAGTLVLAAGDLAAAMLTWVVTFGVGGMLVAAAMLLRASVRQERAIRSILERLDRPDDRR
jgi:hypothetical protein